VGRHRSRRKAAFLLPAPPELRLRLSGIAAIGVFLYVVRMASRDVARLAEGGLIVLHDHARLPARFFGRFTAAILADLRRFG
jgi:hypothetical protein